MAKPTNENEHGLNLFVGLFLALNAESSITDFDIHGAGSTICFVRNGSDTCIFSQSADCCW